MLMRNLYLIPATTLAPHYPAHEWVSKVARIQSVLFFQQQAVKQGNLVEASRLNNQLREVYSH